MNLGHMRLLPEKRSEHIHDHVCETFCFQCRNEGFNDSIDQIAQIPFDLVKFVEVDRDSIMEILSNNQDYEQVPFETRRKISIKLASTMDRWLKVKEPS